MKKISNLPKIAELTIEQALEEFLAEQLKKLKPKTASGYRDVIQLFNPKNAVKKSAPIE